MGNEEAELGNGSGAGRFSGLAKLSLACLAAALLPSDAA